MARVITLVLESSTYAGSVALLDGTRLLGERRVAMRSRDAEALMPAVSALLREQGVAARSVTRVVCGAGPGAFTSLRISGAIAKGIALATGATLVPISSLALLVASREPWVAGRYMAAVDAMRGEHYVQPYESTADGELRVLAPMSRAASPLVDEIASEYGAIVVGPDRGGASAVPLAGSARRITKMIDALDAADLAAWEPGYGRLAEAQVKWEAAHGTALGTG